MNPLEKELVKNFKKGISMIDLAEYYGYSLSQVEEIIRRGFSLPKSKITRKYKKEKP